MPKKKGQNKQIPKDVTLGYYANAQKPGLKPKKCTPADPQTEVLTEVSWDQIPDDEDISIVKKVNADGTTNYSCTSTKKQKNESLSDSGTFNEYPEIVWHEISRRINPEDIGRFALINKTTYRITQQKSFWVNIYERHCKHSPYLPNKLKIEDWAKTYGLKTRIIKALYHTNDFFLKKVLELSVHDSKPHDLIKRRCVNMWFRKSRTHWTLFFKLKKLPQVKKIDYDFMEELGRLDANPELDNQILQVNCEYFNEVPPLMGMTLTSVKLGLSKNLQSHKLIMGFNSSSHVDKNILPDYTITLDKVNTVMVFDWWHPNYPHFEIRFPWESKDRERGEDVDETMLDRDFFAVQTTPQSVPSL